MSPTTKQRPIESIRLGAVSASIWKNTDAGGSVRFNTTIERMYRDEAGNWHSTASFGRDELLTVAKVADLANTRVHELMSNARSLQAEPNGSGGAAHQAAVPNDGR